MDKRLLLLLNPCAGQRRANRLLPEIVRLYNERGYHCETYVTGGAGDATCFLRDHGGRYGRLICIGGDGTLNETIAGMIEGGVDCPVGYIPAGSTNDYANSLGLSTDILRAARDSVEGVPCRFDLGRFNGRNFIYTASCGAFARTSYTTSQVAKNLLGHLAYIFEGIKDLLPSLKPLHMRFESEDRVLEGNYIFCGVTNSLSVGGILKLNPDLVRLNDGMFEVMLVKYPTLPTHWTKILMDLRSNNLPSEMIEFFTARRLNISASEDVEWTLDGERGENGREFTVVNLPQRIELILPQEAVDAVNMESLEDAAEGQLSN